MEDLEGERPPRQVFEPVEVRRAHERDDAAANDRRVTALTGGGWRFAKDAKAEMNAASVAATAFDDSGWLAVEVPHDWAISGPFDPEADGGSGKLPWKGIG